MTSSKHRNRPHAALALVAALTFLGFSLTPAAADDPAAEQIQSDAYLMARLRAQQGKRRTSGHRHFLENPLGNIA